MMATKVIFYRVKDSAAKIQLICMKAHEAVQHEKRLLVSVPTLQAAQYIDALLWKLPEESFLPHVISDAPTLEWIAITVQDQAKQNHSNVNQAARLLNLCSTPATLHQQVEEIYELWDETDPQKTELSQQRFRFYQTKGCEVRNAAPGA